MSVGHSTIVLERQFDIPRERVFDEWLDQNRIGRWLFATREGRMAKVEIDPQVGGGFTIVEERDGQDVAHVGRYLALERPRHLAFAFSVPQFSAEETTVRVDIAPSPKGCILTLTHAGVPADYAQRTREGWMAILEGLARQVGDQR